MSRKYPIHRQFSLDKWADAPPTQTEKVVRCLIALLKHYMGVEGYVEWYLPLPYMTNATLSVLLEEKIQEYEVSDEHKQWFKERTSTALRDRSGDQEDLA